MAFLKEKFVWWTAVIYLVIFGKAGKCTEACPTVRQSAQRVERCPMNEIEWENAAMIKNCGESHHKCASPTRFKYHCALNVYLNESWGVCAPIRYILGFCMEYNELGNRIQDDYRRSCLTMDPPCPSRYISTEAYKYPGCYQTVKQSPDINKETVPSGTEMPSSTHTTMFNDTSTRGDSKVKSDDQSLTWIVVILSSFVIVIASSMSIMMIIYLMRKRKCVQKKEVEINEEESHPLESVKFDNTAKKIPSHYTI